VANGIPLTDFEEVTASIHDWEEWCGAWSARAAIHEEMGRQALADGHTLSAGEHLTTAGVCYHFAKFLFVNDPAEMRAAHMKAVACRRDALPHLRPAGERVEMPYAGKPSRHPAAARGNRHTACRRHGDGSGFLEGGDGLL
jgi:2,6-dihydroxypseudooxynicotine hydrolase